MKLIYMHHAERDRTKIKDRQLQDITNRGIKEAELIAEKLGERYDVKAIYTSPYLRCVHTSEIINKYIDVPIIEDSRLNEYDPSESWKDFLNRNMNLLKELDEKYNINDTVICMTSGVNFSAFVCYFYGIEASNDTPMSQAFNISPVNFVSKGSKID